jgi:hypothetical protein
LAAWSIKLAQGLILLDVPKNIKPFDIGAAVSNHILHSKIMKEN